ncbi:MAG: phospholipase, partial [Peptoniphilus sp.]|nr:phospholipase [Peptoniphilus sp.]
MYIILILLIAPFIYSLFTKNPQGTSVKGEYFNPNSFEFITDLSYEKDGEIVREHNIFQEEIQLIEDAQRFLIIDCFLFNDEYNKGDITYPEQVKEMTDALIAKKA